MSNYEVSSTVVSSVVASGSEYYQTNTGNSVYTFETGVSIGEQGETAVSVATTPLSNIKDPAKLSEVATMLSEVGVSSDNPGNVEVVTTVAPDNGTFKREDAVLIRKQK